VEEAKLDENYGQKTLEVKADSSFTVLSRSCVRRLSFVTGYLQNFTITGALSMPEDEWSTLPSGIRQHQLVSRV
jgi:hypothetical protein